MNNPAIKACVYVFAGVGFFGLMLWGCEDGSYFNANTKQVQSDAVARITATGEDFRLYEFTPQTDKNMQCVFAAATQKGGVFCWRKERL